MPVDGIRRVRRKRMPARKAREYSLLRRFAGAILIVLIVSTLVFILVNIPALLWRAGYKIRPDGAGRSLVKSPYPIESQVKNQLPQAADNASQSPLPAVQDNYLYIEKINLAVPISWQVESADFYRKLQEGVIQISTTALPGGLGNVFITGHSSDFWWNPGRYRTVFALLPELKVGDKINVTYQKKYYTYQVYNVSVVDPEQAPQYALPKRDHPETLTLMTCVPLGTNINRLMVQAERVS